MLGHGKSIGTRIQDIGKNNGITDKTIHMESSVKSSKSMKAIEKSMKTMEKLLKPSEKSMKTIKKSSRTRKNRV